MIIALQSLVFFRFTLQAVFDRILWPYYKKLLLTFKNDGAVFEEEESDDLVYSEFDKDKGVVFFPKMYVQRYGAVIDCLMDQRWCGKLRKVADLGYSDMSFIKYLKDVPGVQTILGVDVQKVPLRCAWDMLGNEEYPFKSDNALHVLLLQGNAADPDYRLIGCDAVVSIEMIEHMNPHDLERLIHTIFGFIKPMVAVITTPNKDFNVLFKNMRKNEMRHWDHRFEWTREQFNDWCSNIVKRYPNYEVACKGIGPPPAGALNVGCCSQLALFTAKHYQKQQDLTPNSLRVLVSSSPVLDLDWEDPSDDAGALSPSSTASPTSLIDLRTESESHTFKIPRELSDSTVLLPALSDKTLQCNLPVETGKSFMMFSDEHEYCWTLMPRRRGDGDYKVYEMEDVASRLNCTTLQVKKFSKTTQRMLKNNNVDALANTGHVVEQIKQLTKMLNLNKDSTENIDSLTTWNNINWGDNAPFWNQYYNVVHEYKYPFEAKSEECLMLELISDEIQRLAGSTACGQTVDPSTLEIPLTHLTALARHINSATDEDWLRDQLEWNGYEVVGDMVIHHRTPVLPEAEPDGGNWRDSGSSEWDIGSDHSDASSIPDYYGRSLRRALDRKVRKLSYMSDADVDVSTELDRVVCRLMTLALKMSNGCDLPLHPRWLECKLYDLLSLTEKSINRRKTRNCATLSLRAIDYGMEEDRSRRLALINEQDDVSVKRIEDSYRHLVKFEDTAEYIAEESSHSERESQSSPINQLSTRCTSKRGDSEFDTGSTCPTTRGICVEDDANLSSSSENVLGDSVSGDRVLQSWMSKDLARVPFVHQPQQYENSTDDTFPKEKEVRQKSPTKSKRKVIFPEKTSIFTGIDVEDISPTMASDDSCYNKSKNKKDKTTKHNKKANQKSSYNSLVKNYAIHLGQAQEGNEKALKVVHHARAESTPVKPIPCSLMNLCTEELAKENAAVHEWIQLEDGAEENELKDTDLASEETQIMSVVMNDIAVSQEHLVSIEAQETYLSELGDNDLLFLGDLNEPSTSKGIRHVNMDAQCGPDTVSTDYPLLTRTPSVKLLKMFKTGIFIGDSTTKLVAETKEIIDFATSTTENGTVRNANSSHNTENTGVLHMEAPLKTMCDTPTLSRTMGKSANQVSNTELMHRSVAKTTTHSLTLNNPVNAKTEEKQETTTTTVENYRTPSHNNCADETKYNNCCHKIDDYSVYSSPCLPSPQHKEVQSTDTSRNDLRSLYYDKKYAPPKLSFVGAHVHSYKEREGSKDILYQGVWQKNRMQWVPKKLSHGDIIAGKTSVTRKLNSKEKLKTVRSHQSARNSTSDLKSSSAPVKRTILKLSTSKDFISKNIVLSSKAKKIHGSIKSATGKSKQSTFYKKAALVLDNKHWLAGPSVVNKEHITVVKNKQNLNSQPKDTLAMREPHCTSANKDKPNPNCTSYSIKRQEIMSNNATLVVTKPDFEPKSETIVDSKSDFISKNTTVAETKPHLLSKNGALVETKPYVTCNGAILLNETKSDLVNNKTFVETKPNFLPNTTLETKSCFPNYTKVIEMQPDCNNVKAAKADPESMINFESLAKLKQDIISSNEVLTRLQQNFEQKMERRIMGTRGRKILNNKHINKVLSKSTVSTVKFEKTKQIQNSSSLKTAPPRPKMEQKRVTKPVNSASTTLLNNQKNKKEYQKPTNFPPIPKRQYLKKRVNFKETVQIMSASPATALAKTPVKINSHQRLKAQVKTPARPRSADGSGTNRSHILRPPIKRSKWMPKHSVETQKLTKDLLKAHDESHSGRNYLVYCSEVEGSDSTDCSRLYEDPDMIRSRYYSSSRTSSNCSSPNSVVTVKSSREPTVATGRQSASMSKVTSSFKEGNRQTPPKAALKRQKCDATSKDNNALHIKPVLKVNVNEQYASRNDCNKNVFIAQLLPETASPLCLSPQGRKCLSPNRLTSPKKQATHIKPILKLRDESKVPIEKSKERFSLSYHSLNTLSQVDTEQQIVASGSISNHRLNESTKEVAILESKFGDDVTEATEAEAATVMREIIEETLKEMDETLCQRSKWPDVCSRTSSIIVPRKKQSDSSQRNNSTNLTEVAEIQIPDITILENTKGCSIKDLYERKDLLTFKLPAGGLAIQAFSGFSMNSPPPVGDQKPDYVSLIDSETGSVAAGIPTRLAASEELYISGRSSESYQSCLVDDEMVVPDWLFHVVSHHRPGYENQYDDDEENYPMPMPTGEPIPPLALQEAGFDLNGNVAEAVPTIARTGAGDGRGIHSDQSQDSSGQGTSFTSSVNSSEPQSTTATDPSVYSPRHGSVLESQSDDDTGEAESSRPGRQNSGSGTPISSTERIYTLLSQAVTSDVDADVSSIGTDDNVSRNHEL